MARSFLIVMLMAMALPGGSAVADVVIDTTRVADSVRTPLVPGDTLADSLPVDSALLPDSLLPDTMTAAQKAQFRFEQRLQQRQQELAEERRADRLSFLDSLFTYFASPRLNLSPLLDQANHHDAGDYFRMHPGFFLIDWQESPMRKTVQPYSLPGDRLGVVQGGTVRHRFEHVPEPTGLLDMNDLPTAPDGEVYIMPGATGMIFGSDRAVASLVTRPPPALDNDAHSAFLVDKGTYGYSNARARFSRAFAAGRRIDFSLGYRRADGPEFFGNDDDAYAYTAALVQPLSDRWQLEADGLLYNREGSLRIDGVRLDRERFDRSGRVGLAWASAEGTAVTTLKYHHERNGDNLARNYYARLNRTRNGVTLDRAWLAGSWLVRAAISGDQTEFDYGSGREERTEAGGEVTLATRGDGLRWALRAGTGWSEEFSTTPFASLSALYESRHWLVMLSAGYVERAPSLLELYLPYRTGSIYSITLPPYADRGNADLQSEKQATGSLTLEAEGSHARCRVEVTGGRIYDGIDWVNSLEQVGADVVRLFEPANGDIEFVTATLQPQVRIADFLRLHAGGSYHYTAYEATATPPYSPEYQAFAGGELHVFWPQRLLHFYAYGEILFSGPYAGLDGETLGEDPVANAKLSVQMGRFRFHFAFNNVFSRVYAQRENSFFVGRYTSYGFVWNFLN